MNIEEYISSGILEAYALGDVSQEERASVEKMLVEHPEIRTELNRVEETLEAMATKGAIAPGKDVKEKIMLRLKSVQPEAKIVTMTPPAKSSVVMYKYVAAAALVIALTSCYLAFDYRSRWIEKEIAFNELMAQNQRVAQDYNVVNQKLDKIEGDLAIIENTAFQKVILKGTENNVSALASVYYNKGTREVYISIQNLKDLAQTKQYQLWAIVDGKPVDVGVFDKNFVGLIKMKNVDGTPALFAVTIEPRGGNPNPTLSTMQVAGAPQAIKG